MNKKSNIKPEDHLSKEDVLGFPLRIPVNFIDSEIGDIIINFEPNEKASKKLLYLYTDYLHRSARLIKEEIELDVISYIFGKKADPHRLERLIIERYKRGGIFGEKFHPVEYIFSYIYLHLEEADNLKYTREREEIFFKQLEKEGPIILRTLTMQKLIDMWFSDKSTVKKRLDRLTDSLIKYSFKKKVKLRKPGG